MAEKMRAPLLLLLVVLLAGMGAPPARAGYTVREEVDLGRRLGRAYEKVNPLTTDAALQARVQRVGQAVVDQMKPQVYPYQFKVVASPEINAITFPGGFIYVYQGIITLTPDDDALSFILAHEVAHTAHRHLSEKIDKCNITALLSGLLSMAIGVNITDLAVQLAESSFSRQNENDADATALEYMSRVGFDTTGAETAMKMLVEVEKTAPKQPRYSRSHPPSDHRLGRIQQKRKELAAQPQVPVAESAPVPEADLAALVGTLPAVVLADNPWFPLQVGNEWTYRVQGRAGPSTSYTLTLLGRTPVSGGTVYRAQVALAKTTAFQHWLTGGGEVWKRGSTGGREAPWQVECLTEVGEGQEVERDGWRYSCVRTESLVTPCGTFPEARVIRRERVSGDDAIELWFVKGVGLAKRVSLKSGVSELLIRYRVGENKTVAPAPVPPVPAVTTTP